MRWEDGQVHMTSLETREANVQECNGVKSVCNSTEREPERKSERKKKPKEAQEKTKWTTAPL